MFLMEDARNMVKIKTEDGKYEFYHFGLGDVTVPCLIFELFNSSVTIHLNA